MFELKHKYLIKIRKYCSQECFQKSRFGRKYTKERCENISKSLMGVKRNEEFRIKARERQLGVKRSEEAKKKTSETLRKRQKESPWGFKKGMKVWNKGMKGFMAGIPRHDYNDEFRKKISAYRRDISIDDWDGFTSFEPYDDKFTRKFKRGIIKRDECCILCGDIGKRMAIHHIDYNKKNTKEKNSVLLCSSCHPKTNIKRKIWTRLFNKYIKMLYGLNPGGMKNE